MLLVIVTALTLGLLRPPQTSVTSETRITLSSDGWTLAGTYREPDPARATRAAVLLLHGAARDRRAYIPLAEELAAQGVASLRLDLRGEGESTNLGRFEPGQSNDRLQGADRDVMVALEWLRRRPGIDRERVGVLGASYSAEEAAKAARQGATATAYVALSPGNFSEESIRAVDAGGRPWWFIASRDERFAHTVVERVGKESRTARVTFVEGTSHASDILSPHVVLNAEIADWFSARLNALSTPRLWGGLPAGAFAVGFSREAVGPLVIDTWYPASHAALRTAALTFADYATLSDDLRDRDPSHPVKTMTTAMTGDPTGAPASVVRDLLAGPMFARRDASRAQGRFPLLLWTPRYATTVAQSVLSEFLASHGFVVAFARTAAGPVRLPFELGTREEKTRELQSKVADMVAATSALERNGAIDTTRIGALAWSYTGEMATLFQQREPRVSLVAGLSTNLVTEWVFQDRSAEQALDLASARATYAVFTEDRARAIAAQARLPDGRSYVVELPGLRHGSFNAVEGFLPSLLNIERVQRWSMSGPEGVSGYEAVASLLLRLARQHVRDDAPRALTPLVLRSGLAREVIVHSQRPPLPPSRLQ